MFNLVYLLCNVGGLVLDARFIRFHGIVELTNFVFDDELKDLWRPMLNRLGQNCDSLSCAAL